MTRPRLPVGYGPLLGVVVTAAALAIAMASGSSPAAAGEGDDVASLIERGRELYETGCSSCHGLDGNGATSPGGEVRGPSLVGAGEAAAFYYLSTGRMPLANSEQTPTGKEPFYGAEDIESLVAYVGSLGDGPPVPEMNLAGADLAEGGELYRSNCAACHSAAGAGGALSYGRVAPRLASVDPIQIAAAVRVGPGEMPVFSEVTLADEDLADIITYVEYLADPEDPGGLPLGRIGPIPEGFVAWLVGIPALLVFAYWLGNRSGHTS